MKKTAEEYELNADAHSKRHVTFATAVTFLQIAMAISAISVILRRRFLWHISIAVAITGLYFFVRGLI